MNKIKRYISKINGYMEDQQLKGKRSFLRLLLDIVICNILYGATISDYFYFRFYNKTHFARKEFMTAKDKNRFYHAMNDEKERYKVQNKDCFNKIFAQYLKRESINTPECGPEEFSRFIQEHDSVFIKPIATGGGEGIQKVTRETAGDLDALYTQVCKKGPCVIEAGIVQHPDMAALHPESVNTIRISTIYDGEKVNILFAQLRCGTGNSFVDNHNAGGVSMLLDVENGRVRSLASGRRAINIVRHPDTGIFLPGYQIPHWDKCLELIDEAARKVEKVRYVGWDLAILPDGVCLIEANPGGAFNVYQEAIQTGCKRETDAWVEKIQKLK